MKKERGNERKGKKERIRIQERKRNERKWKENEKEIGKWI